jgi:TP901 family phage tail tape measure protein
VTSSRMVRIIIAADVANAIRGFQQVETGMKNVATTSKSASTETSSFGDSLKKGLASVGLVTGIAAVGAAIMGTLRVGMQFEDNMNTLKAVTGGTAAEMTKASAHARALGSDLTLPSVSAGDAAEAMLALSKGGLTLQESMNAARGTLLLAAAANISGAEAAQFQSAALKTFNIDASQAGRVADVLANTANSAAGEITDFGAGLQQAGTVANSFGWSIEETTTMLGLMANAGIRGSDAGTSLKTALTQLLTPTSRQAAALADLGVNLRDSSGQMLSARDLSAQLAAARERMSSAEFAAAAATAFGTDAVRTALVAAQAGSEGYDRLAGSVGRAGGAQAVAEARTQGLSGAMGKFSSVVQDLALSIYEKLSPALQAIVDFGTTVVGAIGDVVTWISNLPGPILAVAGALGGWLLLRGPITSLFTAIGSGISGMMTGMGTLSGAAGKIGPLLLRAFGGPIGLAITGVTLGFSLLAAAGPSVEDTIAAIDERMGALIGTLDASTGAITQATQATLAKQLADDGMLARIEELGVSTETFVDAATNQAGAMEDLRSQVTDATSDLLAHSEAYQTVEDALKAAGVTQGEYIRAVQNGGDDLANVEGKVNAYAEGVARASGNVQDANDIQNNFRAAVDATTGPLQNANGIMNLAGDTANRLAAEVDAAAQVQKALGEAADASGMSVEELSAAAGDAAPSVEGLKAATEEMGAASAYADEMTKFLLATIDELNNGSIDAQSNANKMASALRDIGTASRDVADAKQTEADKEAALKELRDSGTASAAELAAAERDLADASDGVSDAQDKQYQTHIDVRDEAVRQAGEAYALAEANGDLEGASAALNGVLTTQKGKFIEAQIAAGMEEAAAVTLADQLFAIPDDVLTKIKEQGAAEVQRQAATVKQNVEAIPTQWNTRLSVVDNITAAALGAARAIIGIPTSWSTSITTTNRTVNETINRGTVVAVDLEGGYHSFESGGLLRAQAGLITGRGRSQKRKGSGTGVLWAEEGTGEEYYISMKPGAEDRNRKLLAQAAGDLGGQAIFPGSMAQSTSMSGGAGSVGGKIVIELTGEGITDEIVRTARVVSNDAIGSVAVELRRAGDQW